MGPGLGNINIRICLQTYHGKIAQGEDSIFVLTDLIEKRNQNHISIWSNMELCIL